MFECVTAQDNVRDSDEVAETDVLNKLAYYPDVIVGGTNPALPYRVNAEKLLRPVLHSFKSIKVVAANVDDIREGPCL